jgi:hypothetical protein
MIWGVDMLAILLLCTLPLDLAKCDQADIVEINHHYDYDGRHVFTQSIWWELGDDSEFVVIDWRMQKLQDLTPIPTRGGYLQVWEDGERIRVVRSRHYRETWTQYDPELLDRERIPKEQRRELRR